MLLRCSKVKRKGRKGRKKACKYGTKIKNGKRVCRKTPKRRR